MTKRLTAALILAALVGVGVFLAVRWQWRRPPSDRPTADDGAGAALASLPDAGDEWPRFRGPEGLGVSRAGKPPLEWSATKNLKWKTPLPGPGSSSPVVWGARVWVTCFSGHDDGTLKRHLVCVRRGDGKVLWTRTVDAAQPEDPYSGYLREHGYASHTPCTDGERVYAFFGKTGVIAYTIDGEELWRADVGKQSSNRRWGSAASPILYGDLVIVNASEEGRAVFAFDRKTGKEVWKAAARATELSFGTPVLVPIGEGKVELVLAVPGQMWGLNPATGGLLWHAAIDLPGNVSPSVCALDGVVFATGGYPGTRTVAVKAGGRGNVTQTHLLWTVSDASYVPSPTAAGGRVYLVSDQGFAICLDAATGQRLTRRRLSGGETRAYASPVLAGGRLYAVTRRGGVYVLEAAPEMKQLAVNRFTGDDSDFNGSPAMSKGQLFLRSDRALYCVEESSK